MPARPQMMLKRPLNVLVACEESQAITKAFRDLGHNAFSCDLQRTVKCAAWHIVGDATPYLNGMTVFRLQNGSYGCVPGWDLIIAHPPCTYLCRLSGCQLTHHGVIDQERLHKLEAGREFFLRCLNAKAPFVAVENPIPLKRANLPRPTTYIEPFWFGVKYSKKTLLWLKNLPPITPTLVNPHYRCYVTASRGKYRSRTFPAVAEAIAKQWSDFIINNYPDKPKRK